jgi:hypothetical protein
VDWADLRLVEQDHQLRGAIFFRAEMLFASTMHANTRRKKQGAARIFLKKEIIRAAPCFFLRVLA